MEHRAPRHKLLFGVLGACAILLLGIFVGTAGRPCSRQLRPS